MLYCSPAAEQLRVSVRSFLEGAAASHAKPRQPTPTPQEATDGQSRPDAQTPADRAGRARGRQTSRAG
eukprot:12868532-Prorocentrum_lima.AAC.1